jgi:hypothetical protein
VPLRREAVAGGPFGGRHATERSGEGARPDRHAAGGPQWLGHGACVGGPWTGEDGVLTHGPGLCAGF